MRANCPFSDDTPSTSVDGRSVSRTPRLDVRTRPWDAPGHLLGLLPRGWPAQSLDSWVRDGRGHLGWGCAAEVQTSGTDRFDAAQSWWREVVDSARQDRCDLPFDARGGLMAFGSFAFSPHSARGGLLRVPHVILSRYDGHTMLTTVVDRDQTADAQIDAAHRSWEETVPGGNAAVSDPTDPGEVAFADGALSGPAWQSVVATAVDNIRAGALDKVVLARDLIAECDAPVDPRWLLRRLAADYAKTWVFAVDALVGATPEMLCRLDRGRVTSRVLAGTIRRTGDEAHDLASAAALTRSSKDLEEHAYAVRSVADALAPHCRDVDAPATPFVLRLPNVLHLASDVTGRLSDGLTSLALAAALHPSAAVCGTPRQDAADLIDEVESMDRGRYAGPVGWIDAHGDGEWGIALRCGEIDPERSGRIRLFAGCGVVAASDPAAELAESNAKLVPMRSALGPGPLVH